ncbi:MAG: hypothetical protein BGO03_01775 [Mesorhizobium sp. 61-13]|nr:MAG: hypothetical protein BGO03_01775 [Mesorhizobium sp. 61-13]
MTETTKTTPQARWRERNPLATWAHAATRSALRRGLLVPPDACEKCGKAGRLDAHHDDHHDPLSVRFWCRACHRQHHAAARREKAEGC